MFGVVRSLREGGEELLTFFTFPKTQWKTLRITNVIEHPDEKFRRRVKTHGALPTEDSAVTTIAAPEDKARDASSRRGASLLNARSRYGDRARRVASGFRPHRGRSKTTPALPPSPPKNNIDSLGEVAPSV